MADDRSQRPYHPNDLPVRGAPAAAPQSAGDPLAELARLIGQNDPFAEFGRDGARRAAPQRQAEPPVDWSAQPVGYPPQAAPTTAPNFGAGDYYAAPAGRSQPAQYDGQQFAPPPPARQAYGNAAYAGDLYRTERDTPGYAGGHPGGYDSGPYFPNQTHQGGDESDLYDDEPPPRRRISVMAIAAVFALAVVGTAGAFGYRAMFGSSASNRPPPVIKADATPSKIVPPAKTKDLQANKMINDRVNERGQGEKMVSREEQPVEMNGKTAGFPGSQPEPSGTAQQVLGSGVVGSEPKKIHTIFIRPDQIAGNAPSATAAPAAAMTRAPAPQPVADPPPHRQTVVAAAAAAPPAQHHAAAVSRNAPLSLDPDAQPAPPAAPARAAPAVMRTAAAAPPTRIAPPEPARARNVSAGSSGAYAVQVSAQRSEAEAETAFHSLQAKYPGQLGGRAPIIHRVDLGPKGIYFRAMVGPFASSEEAGQLCSNLKAAGGSCLIQKN